MWRRNNVFMAEEPSFEHVEQLLDADFSAEDPEVTRMYDEVERFADIASVYDSAGENQNADYFRELAVETYKGFLTAVSLDKKSEGDETYLKDE